MTAPSAVATGLSDSHRTKSIVFVVRAVAMVAIFAMLVLARRGESSLTVIDSSVYLLQTTAVVLLWRRLKPADVVSPSRLVIVFPSILMGALLLQIAPEPSRWSGISVAVFVAGTALAIGALLRLGQSFGLVPAQRPLVDGGPYRIVRHPAYLGEMTMCAAAILATVSAPDVSLGLAALAGFLFTALVVAVAWRIQIEERVMSADPGWDSFTRATRWRLLPGAW